MKKSTYVKPDARNRVVLTKIARNIASLYKIYQQGEKIVLEPVKEIPEEEKWLFEPQNKKLLAELKRRMRLEKASVDWDKIKHKYE